MPELLNKKVVDKTPVYVVVFPSRTNDKHWHEYRHLLISGAEYHAKINVRRNEYFEIREYTTVSENNGYPPWRLSHIFKVVKRSTDLVLTSNK